MRFVKDVSLADLGTGAGVFIWGFRACAAGRVKCRAIVLGYNQALGDTSTMGLATLDALAREISHAGLRRVLLSSPGSGRVTYDELSLIAAMSAAQGGRKEEAKAHLSWLLGRAPINEVCDLLQLAGRAFSHAKLTVKVPTIEISHLTEPFISDQEKYHSYGGMPQERAPLRLVSGTLS